MKKWQAVFWDFDGVVLDSVHVKTRTFARMFSVYGPDIEQAVVKYHLAHGGVSRFEKFKYYYEHLLKRSITDHELATLGEEFSGLALEEVLAVPFISGALETLQELSRKGIPSYVVSGTPEEEVRHIVIARELSSYFVEVHGSPRKKAEILADIVGRMGYVTEQCLFLGDAMTDYDAALAVGTQFLGIVPEGEPLPFPDGTAVSTVVCCDVDGCILPSGNRQ
jgi:phosphoglycolate phosphatase-like HAD superfamily hydrolase